MNFFILKISHYITSFLKKELKLYKKELKLYYLIINNIDFNLVSKNKNDFRFYNKDIDIRISKNINIRFYDLIIEDYLFYNLFLHKQLIKYLNKRILNNERKKLKENNFKKLQK